MFYVTNFTHTGAGKLEFCAYVTCRFLQSHKAHKC